MLKKMLTVAATAVFILTASAFGAAHAATIGHYGNWETVAGDDSTGVLTTFDDGSKFALVVIDDELHMLIYDPDWDLSHRQKVPVTIDVDDADDFRGVGTAVNDSTLDVPVANMSFLQDFIRGDAVTLEVFDENWRMPLDGSAAAIRRMIAASD